jgi:integrase
MAARQRTRPRGSIKQLKNGSVRVRVYAGTDPVTGKRHYLDEVAPAGPEAWRHAEKTRTRLNHQVDEARQPRTAATFNQLLDRYFSTLVVEQTTLARYQQVADLHLRPLIGAERVGRITGDVIDSLYTELRRCRDHCGNTKGKNGRRTRSPARNDRTAGHECKPLAEGTIRKVHYIISGAFKKAKYWGWVAVSPIDQAEPPAPAPAHPQPPSAEDTTAILNRAWYNDPEWGTQVWLSMVTGSRRGEICAIRWRHLDLDNGVLHMGRAIAQDGSEIWEKDTKSHQDRRIVLDPQTVELLAEHWERCTKRTQDIGIDLPKDAYVFSNEPDGSMPLKPSSVTQRYRRLVRALSIDTHLHALRHYSATELIAAGVDIRTVAGRLGHGSGGSTTLRVYAAWLSEADQRASSALLGRLPAFPERVDTPQERAKVYPRAPFELIASQIRKEIVSGQRQPGEDAPTVNELRQQHIVSAGTAHRALGLLREWHLISETQRGRRSTILPIDIPEASTPSDGQPVEQPATSRADRSNEAASTPLKLRLLLLGEQIKEFSTRADPGDADQLHRLLTATARRHAGNDVDLLDYELEVRHANTDELITTFVSPL